MKGISTLGIVIIIGLVAGGMFLVGVPSAAMGWINQITGTVQNCNDDPYSNICNCQSNERKVDVPWLGIPRWHCENVQELLIDPESPTFETDAISFAQSYLGQYCGDVCTDLSCGTLCENNRPPLSASEPPCIVAIYGYGSSGARIVNIECMTFEYSPWRMNFFIESTTNTPKAEEMMVQSNYCIDPDVTTRCTHQSICDAYPGNEWCVGDLPLDVVPNNYLLMINPFGPSNPPI